MVSGLASCNAVYEDQSDCAIRYRVGFRFVKNVLHADAFGSQVTTVHLNVYDKSGKLVLSKTEDRRISEINDYGMDVDLMPGTYDLVSWCEGPALSGNPVSFILGDGTAMTDFTATLPLQGTAPNLTSGSDLTRLFHGTAMDVEFPEHWGMTDIGPVYLTKDTNRLRVLMQNVDGMPMDATQFKFEITGNNNALDWNNAVMKASDKFIYTPWSVEQTYATFDKPDNAATRSTMDDPEVPAGVLAEFSTSRLMADMPQRLTISLRDTGEEVLSIPLIQYLLLVKDKYSQTTDDQDYLDCYDDYTMMFFIDKGMTWLKARVYINGWRVVPPQDEQM